MMTSELIYKYLKKQNLSNWVIELNNNRKYNNIIVIPALDELPNITKPTSFNLKKFQ